ncbi:HSF-type DNA-binding-domain-containing protein [Thamnocephalis sphaerospora]|uniref:HSF-type DNA-binding-domain-containing protein n=1 Tax=Thamnocephalis sphaerospora TaxID=78915 RepID=A0A4P9XRY8_9FUNG|nr:HSF-type DNA-binding-domain-containing protein [Thamnocephalis sphaerospora]|eukprot:RKP08874.1 HSF-type DNA-binding-domain-containing protein [Thamnocephalis sphaerospora]
MFIDQLYEILECGYFSHIVGWDENGTSFYVHNQEAMTHDVLPTFSAQTHFSSFERQLNMYGFERLSDGRKRKRSGEASRFAHPYFVSGAPELLGLIRRKQRSSGRASSLPARKKARKNFAASSAYLPITDSLARACGETSSVKSTEDDDAMSCHSLLQTPPPPQAQLLPLLNAADEMGTQLFGLAAMPQVAVAPVDVACLEGSPALPAIAETVSSVQVCDPALQPYYQEQLLALMLAQVFAQS